LLQNERGESAQVAPNSLRRFGSSASNLPLTSTSLPTPLPAETTSTVSAVPAQLHREAGLQLPAPSALHHGSGPAARGGGKRYKRYAKPPYSYVSLITLAILSSPEKKLRLAQILKRIAEMFPFFNGSYQGWRDSVRHNLSQNECFVKVSRRSLSVRSLFCSRQSRFVWVCNNRVGELCKFESHRRRRAKFALELFGGACCF